MARAIRHACFILVGSTAAALLLCAQGSASDIAGDWTGKLDTGSGSLRLVLHINADSAGKLSARLDSIDQGATIPTEHVALNGSAFSFDASSVHGSYRGTLSSDGQTITGEWTQGRSLPLVLHKQKPPPANLKPSPVDGDWSGVLRAGGVALRLVLHVKTIAEGKLEISLDSLDQDAMGLGGENAELKGDDFHFDIPSVHGTYKGKLAADHNTLTGTWSQGTPLPLEFKRESKQSSSPPVLPPAAAPVPLRDLKEMLDREFAPLLAHGVLAPFTGGGVAIGIFDHGQSQVFAYGTARSDSLFEIGSITKTFTGLLLAQMSVEKQVSLDAPVRLLLPAGAAPKPAGAEITLLDLATQHSGLPRLPDNLQPADQADPYADYDGARLLDFVRAHGLARPSHPSFLYSNFGFGLLGFALACRAGMPYEGLLQREITGPLRMSDTVVTLSAAQQKRLLAGHAATNDSARPWKFAALVGAGGLKSSVPDMLVYLEANLHPEKLATSAPAGSPLATLPAAIALDHQLHGEGPSNHQIALAWWFDPQTGAFSHNGGTAGFSSLARFIPSAGRAIVVLYNRQDQTPGKTPLVDAIADNVTALLSGKPALPLDR